MTPASLAVIDLLAWATCIRCQALETRRRGCALESPGIQPLFLAATTGWLCRVVARFVTVSASCAKLRRLDQVVRDVGQGKALLEFASALQIAVRSSEEKRRASDCFGPVPWQGKLSRQ